MKRKTSIFLTISMMVICVSAIAFGIYAAQQARLNISGNLGFTAHNAFVSVTGTIKNVAKIENDNVVSKTDIPIDKIVKSADTAEIVDISMPLGDMYFYSSNKNVSAEDIVFELTFTNLGETDVLATIIKPTIATSVSVIDNSDGNHSLYISFGETGTHQVGIYKGESQTISFAMHLNDMSNLSSKVSFNMPINFEEWIYKIGVTVNKFTSLDQSSIRSTLFDSASITDANILCYAERFPYYVEMGTEVATGAKLRWLIVGAMDASDNISVLTTTDTDAFAEGKMLNKNYCLLSENCLYTEDNSTNYGMSFQNAYSGSPYSSTKYGVSERDYSASNVREYLKGNIVQRSFTNSSGIMSPSGSEVNFYSTYNFTNDSLFLQVKERTLTSLYNEPANGNLTQGMTQVPDDKDGYTPIDRSGDKFWLLSITEILTICANDNITGNQYGSAIAKIQGTTLANTWWSRTDAYRTNCVCSVDSQGKLLNGTGIIKDDVGVRPAFKI